MATLKTRARGVEFSYERTAQGAGSSQLTSENVQVANTLGLAPTFSVEDRRVMVGLPQRISLPNVGEELHP